MSRQRLARSEQHCTETRTRSRLPIGTIVPASAFLSNVSELKIQLRAQLPRFSKTLRSILQMAIIQLSQSCNATPRNVSRDPIVNFSRSLTNLCMRYREHHEWGRKGRGGGGFVFYRNKQSPNNFYRQKRPPLRERIHEVYDSPFDGSKCALPRWQIYNLSG